MTSWMTYWQRSITLSSPSLSSAFTQPTQIPSSSHVSQPPSCHSQPCWSDLRRPKHCVCYDPGPTSRVLMTWTLSSDKITD
ncbi:hypothetical protein BD413DRAFT_576504 [Trametes elegans]|nr:hypothetical protein BD413DRAFT_576504 [Trametes elegans]